MESGLQISVVLSTYQRPAHLRRSLLSLALQRGVAGQFEVVVTDDGSKDDTAEVVKRFGDGVEFPVRLVTQEHDGFRLARCRNNGVRASGAPYLLFSDGDCIFPPDHLLKHLRARRRGFVFAGNCYRLDRHTTQRVDDDAIMAGTYQRWVSPAERSRVHRRWIKDSVYAAIRHPTKPKLVGCNVAIWRSDLEKVNGFDEHFVGWGCEDDDLAQRLRWSGLRIASILRRTQVYHLWHPVDPSRPVQWADGANVKYLRRRDKPIRCRVGLVAFDADAAGQPARHQTGTADQAPSTRKVA